VPKKGKLERIVLTILMIILAIVINGLAIYWLYNKVYQDIKATIVLMIFPGSIIMVPFNFLLINGIEDINNDATEGFRGGNNMTDIYGKPYVHDHIDPAYYDDEDNLKDV